MSTFKIIVTAIFSVCFVVGVILFAMYKAGTGQAVSNIVVWGTFSSQTFQTVYKASSVAGNKSIVVKYVQQNPSDFDAKFTEALADGVGPDVVILPDNDVYKNRNRLLVIPFTSFPERTFKDLFIQEAEEFLRPDGVVALPLAIDPMVMYWNRDIFSNNQVSQPPKYWDEMYSLVSTLTHRDTSANITQATIPFGGWTNVGNVKDILSLLFLQAGTPIVSYNSLNQAYESVIDSTQAGNIIPGQVALDFYTQFSNPTSASYTWNKSLPPSLNFFLSGNLAMYFGYASELFDIQDKNPNLNFDVARVPQVRDATAQVDFARMYAISIVKQSKSIAAAFSLVTAFIEPAAQTALEKETTLPPVRRDLLASVPTDPFRVVFYNSAVISRSWIDPDPVETGNIFRDMIDGITSGRTRTYDALTGASSQINALLK